jgi:hypothetical protein
MPCLTSLLLLAPLLMGKPDVIEPPVEIGALKIGMTVIEANRGMQRGRALRTVPRPVGNVQALAQAYARGKARAAQKGSGR